MHKTPSLFSASLSLEFFYSSATPPPRTLSAAKYPHGEVVVPGISRPDKFLARAAGFSEAAAQLNLRTDAGSDNNNGRERAMLYIYRGGGGHAERRTDV